MNIYTKTSRIALIALVVIIGPGLFASKAQAQSSYYESNLPYGYTTTVPVHGMTIPYGQVADNGVGFSYSNLNNAIVTGLGGYTTPYNNPLIYPQYNGIANPVYTGNVYAHTGNGGNQYSNQNNQYYYNNTNTSNYNNTNPYLYGQNTNPYQYNQNNNGQYNQYNNQGTITLNPSNGNQNNNQNTNTNNDGSQTIVLIPTDGTNTNTNNGNTGTNTGGNTGNTGTGTGNYGNTW